MLSFPHPLSRFSFSFLLSCLFFDAGYAAPPATLIEPRGQGYTTSEGYYTPDVLRRRDSSGELVAKIHPVPDSAPTQPQSPLQNILSGNPSHDAKWLVTASNAESFNAGFVIDLGEPLTLGAAQFAWLNSTWSPCSVEVMASMDGKNYKSLNVSPRPTPERLYFDAITARYVKVHLRGVGSAGQGQVSLGAMRLYLSNVSAPPTEFDGYPLTLLPGVTYSAGPHEVWWHPASILDGTNRLKVHPDARKDAPITVNLKGKRQLSFLNFVFHPGNGPGWENGVRIEIAEQEKGPWKSVYHTTDAFKGGIIPLNEEAGFIRIVNLAGDEGPSKTNLVLFEAFGPVKKEQVPLKLAVLKVPDGEKASAGIFDEKGNLVRTLITSQQGLQGALPLYWDGYDDHGESLPGGTYEWRAILSAAKGTNIGSVGDSGKPPYNENEALGSMSAVAFDSAGHLYQAGWWVERHFELRKSTFEGKTLWEVKKVGIIALAADDKDVFVSVSPSLGAEDRVYRISSADGSAVAFGNGKDFLAFNPGKTKKPKAALFGKDKYLWESLNGLALDTRRLWVSNYASNSVEVFNRATGESIASLAVDAPLGIGVRENKSGIAQAWVVSGSKVLGFATSGDKIVRRPELDIVAGASPMNISVRDGGRQLAIGDSADGVIRFFAIDAEGRTTPEGEFGSLAKPGPIRAGEFRAGDVWGIAIHPDGALAVADPGNRSVWVFGKDRELLRQEFSEFQPAPFVFEATPTRHGLLSGPWEYLVDFKEKERDDPMWHGDGTWTLRANWTPADRRFFQDKSIIRTLENGRTYLWYLQTATERGASIYDITGDTLRLSSIVGTAWRGLDGTLEQKMALWTWRDARGDGSIDWDAVRSDPEGQVKFHSKIGENHGFETRAPGVWVDKRGDLWFARVNRAAIKLPLQGFDEKNNPIYDFEKREIIVPADRTPEEYIPTNLKTNLAGDVYVLGFSKRTGGHPYLWMGGKEIRVYSPAGVLKHKLVMPEGKTISSFDFDPLKPEMLYTADNRGSDHAIQAWSADGLCLAVVLPDHEKVGKTGWVDHFMGLTAFSPDGKRRMVYAEDVYHGKSILYEFHDLVESSRLSGPIHLKTGQTILR